jgi:DNA-binding Xre family transcriptional regulator
MLITIKLIYLRIKIYLLLLYLNYKNYVMNEKLKGQIEYAMFKNKITKKELSSYMNMSYPTMLSKIESPGTLKISEAKRLCDILNINLGELLTIK